MCCQAGTFGTSAPLSDGVMVIVEVFVMSPQGHGIPTSKLHSATAPILAHTTSPGAREGLRRLFGRHDKRKHQAGHAQR